MEGGYELPLGVSNSFNRASSPPDLFLPCKEFTSSPFFLKQELKKFPHIWDDHTQQKKGSIVERMEPG